MSKYDNHKEKLALNIQNWLYWYMNTAISATEKCVYKSLVIWTMNNYNKRTGQQFEKNQLHLHFTPYIKVNFKRIREVENCSTAWTTNFAVNLLPQLYQVVPFLYVTLCYTCNFYIQSLSDLLQSKSEFSTDYIPLNSNSFFSSPVNLFCHSEIDCISHIHKDFIDICLYVFLPLL